MRLPNAEHAAHPWVIAQIAPDFELIDAWALPAQGGRDDFAALLKIMAAFRRPVRGHRGARLPPADPGAAAEHQGPLRPRRRPATQLPGLAWRLGHLDEAAERAQAGLALYLT